MKSGIHFILVFFLFGGLFLTGLVGTSTSMTFVWPGYLALGVAGILSIGLLFRQVSFSLSQWTIIPVLLLIFYLLTRAADSPVAYFAREDAIMVVACFIAYAAVLSLCTAARWRKGVALAFAFLVLVNLGFAALQAMVDPAIWLVPGYGRTMTHAVGGLFNQPDHFAIFLAALVPLWLAMAVQGRESRLFRLCWAGLAGISVLFLLIAGSVPGFLTLGTGLLCYAALTLHLVSLRLKLAVRRFGVVLLVVSGFGLLFAGLVAGGPSANRFGHGFFTDPDSGGLVSLWKVGLKQAAESPFVGTGSRSSQIYLRSFRTGDFGAVSAEPEFLHNEFLQMLGDYGVIGLVLLLAVLGVHFAGGLRFLGSFRRMKPAKGELIPRSNHLALSTGAIATLSALGAAAMTDFVFHLPVVALLAAVLLAVLAVPDPMARGTERERSDPLIPGGTLLFSVRAMGFGGGLALAALGAVFVQSEYHYELARKEFESGGRNFQQFRHLQNARGLDSKNPFVHSLSAHAQVGMINREMPLAERRQALEKADLYFSRARQLYPQDVFAAVGHVAVLDELGRMNEARARLREARQWAPLYGNLMLAEAEHYLRNGRISLAKEAYTEALAAPAFRDVAAAEEGLRTLSEWKLIAQQNGIPLDSLESDFPGDRGLRRVLPDAVVDERILAGQTEAGELQPLSP